MKKANKLQVFSAIITSFSLLVGTVATQSSIAQAATHTQHVDQNNPRCVKTGMGLIDEPYCTISLAAKYAIGGVEVVVASGTYSEQVTIAFSGSESQPVVFRAAPGATVIVQGKTNGFKVSSKSWITIQGFTIKNTTGDGILVQSSSRIRIANNHVSRAGQPKDGYIKYGIYLNATNDSEVLNNIAEYNTNHGITLSSSHRNRLSGNRTSFNARGYIRAANGIYLGKSNNNVVIGNTSFRNEDSGISLFAGSADNFIINNLTHDNGDHGIDSSSSPRQTIVGNTVYKNVTAGIQVEGGATYTTVANNISVDNAYKSPRGKGNIRIDAASIPGTTLAFDLVYQSQPEIQIAWGSKYYYSMEAFRTATKQEAGGLEAHPQWVSPATGDFHLTMASPAIDSASADAKAAVAYDLENRLRFDVLERANTGIGVPDYSDRGAFEYQHLFAIKAGNQLKAIEEKIVR